MPRYQFCESCMELVERAEAAKLKELPVPELATDALVIHDGTREYIAHLCHRHYGVALTLAVEQWGHTEAERAIAFPAEVH